MLQTWCQQSSKSTRKLNGELKVTFNNKNPLLLWARIPQSNVGQDVYILPTPRVTSQKADIMRRILEVSCWLWLGCLSNNSTNSHLSPGAFNIRKLLSCLVPQCSHTSHWSSLTWMTLCELWLDACVLHQITTFQSSQASNLLSFIAKEPHCL